MIGGTSKDEIEVFLFGFYKLKMKESIKKCINLR